MREVRMQAEFFFFQAEDGIRDYKVTGVQTCALPIYRQPVWKRTIVILAGVTMNIVFAYCVFAGIAATVGAPELASTQIESVTTRTPPPGPPAPGTLKFCDRIVRVNGDTVRSWNAIIDHVQTSSPA